MSDVRGVFRAGAISNFLVTVYAILDPEGNWATVSAAQSLLPASWQAAVRPLNYPSLLIIWSAMAFLWGIMMWEISRDPLRNAAMIKYTYLEKGITTYAISWGTFWHGSMPLVVFLFILYTDVLWIVLFVVAHVRVRRHLAERHASG
jgi:hypothetical protein